MKYFFVLFLTLSILTSSKYFFLQEKASPAQEVTTIEFELSNNLISIPVYINGKKEKLHFIFDTGASTCVLDSEVAKKYQISSNHKTKATGATGAQTYQIARIEELKIGDIRLRNTNCVLVDLNHLSQRVKIDGIIGNDILKKYAGRIDYDREVISLCEDISRLGDLYQKKLDFDFYNNTPIPQTEIGIRLKNGAEFKGRVFMDSGAAPCFVLNSNITRQNKLLPKFSPKIKTTSLSLTGSNVEYESTIEQLNLNGDTFSDVPIDIPTVKKGVNARKGYLGILGNGIMYRYNWIFDYKHKKAYYQANKYLNADFPYPSAHFFIQKKGDKMYFKDVQTIFNYDGVEIAEGLEVISVNNKTVKEYAQIAEWFRTLDKELDIWFLDKKGQKKRLQITTKRVI